MKLAFFALMILATLCSSANAAIAPDMAVGAVSGLMKDRLNGVFDKAQNSADAILFKIAADLRALLYSLDQVLTSQRTVLFRDLTSAQQELFRNIDNSLALAEQGVDKALREAEQLSLNAGQIVADVKFWSNNPGIYRVTSPVVFPAGQTSPHRVTVRGVNLTSANALLEVDGNRLQPVQKSLTELAFDLPASSVAADAEKALFKDLALHLDYKPGWLSSRKQDSYPVRILILPETIGEIAVSVVQETTERQYTDLNVREFHHSSGDLSWNCRSFPQGPRNDYVIDTTSVGVQRVWGKAGRFEIESNSPGGFVARVCAKRWSRGFRTGSGNQHALVQWREYKTVPSQKEATVSKFVAKWKDSQVVPLPPGSKGVIVTLKYKTGRVDHIVERGSNGTIKVEFDGARARAVISPVVPTSASAFSIAIAERAANSESAPPRTSTAGDPVTQAPVKPSGRIEIK